MKPVRSDFSFTRRPKWIAGHLLALAGIVVFAQLGLWQLRRLEERRDVNATATSRLASDYRPLTTLLDTYGANPADLVWRRVAIDGTFDTSVEVIVQGRSYRGQSGHHVATPLVLSDGRALIVNRGWVPIDVEGPPVVGAEPPAGLVTVRGLVRESQVRVVVGPVDSEAGTLERVARVDVARLQLQSGYDLYDFYVDLEEQIPAQDAGRPAVLEPPEFGEGSHLSYAIQWFIFAMLVAIGYPILLYRTSLPTGRPPAPQR